MHKLDKASNQVSLLLLQIKVAKQLEKTCSHSKLVELINFYTHTDISIDISILVYRKSGNFQ